MDAIGCVAGDAHTNTTVSGAHSVQLHIIYILRQNKESHERAAERLADQTTRAPWNLREMGGRERSNSHLSVGSGQRDRARTMEGGNLAIRCGAVLTTLSW